MNTFSRLLGLALHIGASIGLLVGLVLFTIGALLLIAKLTAIGFFVISVIVLLIFLAVLGAVIYTIIKIIWSEE